MHDTIITAFLGCLQKEAAVYKHEVIDLPKSSYRVVPKERLPVPLHTPTTTATGGARRLPKKLLVPAIVGGGLLAAGGAYAAHRAHEKDASAPIINSGISAAIKRLLPGEAAPVLDKAKGLFERIGEPIKEIPGAVSTLFTPKEQILKQVRATKGLSPEHVKVLATPEGQKHVVSATRRAAALQAARGMVPATIIGGGTYKLMKPQQDQYNMGYPLGSTPPPA